MHKTNPKYFVGECVRCLPGFDEDSGMGYTEGINKLLTIREICQYSENSIVYFFEEEIGGGIFQHALDYPIDTIRDMKLKKLGI